jgi:predicted DNA-binding antitoxin AbrB/MazE fold protein
MFGENINWGEGENNRVKVADEKKLEEITKSSKNNDRAVEEKLKESNHNNI